MSVLKSYARFQNPAEFDLKSQVHDFRPKLHDTKFIAITTLLLNSQFKIAEFSQYQYLIDLLAGSLKAGTKSCYISVFKTEMM